MSSPPAVTGEELEEAAVSGTPRRTTTWTRIASQVLALLLWLAFVALTVLTWVPFSRVGSSPRDFGIGVVWTTKCDELSIHASSLPSLQRLALLLVTILATAVTVISSFFLSGLLVPSPSKALKSGGRRYWGLDSWVAFRHASITRKTLYVMLLLSNFPVYFLSNTLFIAQYSAYTSYEVVVGEDFFRGASFDLSAVRMTRFHMNEDPTMPARDLPWPTAYGGFDRLNDSLARLQREPGLWVNLSRADCLAEFNQPRYTKYRTVLVVTDFGQPHSLVASNNSVLAVGILAGYRLASASSSLEALCPDTYLAAYPHARAPDTPPLMPLDASYGNPEDFRYCDPAEAAAWATKNSSLSASSSTTGAPRAATFPKGLYGRQIMPVPNTNRETTFDSMLCRDLCYQYWPKDDPATDPWEYKGLAKDRYMAPRADFTRCVAEPVTEPPLCQVVYSEKVLFVLAVIMSIILACIPIALILRLSEDGVYDRAQAKELGLPLDLPDRTSLTAFGEKGWWTPIGMELDLMNLVIFCYIWVLWGLARSMDWNQLIATNSNDGGWLIKARAVYNVPLLLFQVLFFFQTNELEKHILAERGADAGGQSLRKYLTLPVRGFLVKYVYSLVFITKLQAVMPLEATGNSLDGGTLVLLSTFGIPRFNESTQSAVLEFLVFHLAVFIFLPTLWLDAELWMTRYADGARRQSMSFPTSWWTIIGGPLLVLLSIVIACVEISQALP
ncbi:hypothetical protein B0T19DRAFT_446717 [Cercophora scortea]|uniref:DUF6536 domain-containing protein n=1 Tax=Cercophora scortea TaxID=314031 RepID=A0AAE0M3F4_9PEZI|nr:hypothetical protein B0T19DRAFT_446717 [Cercophora scortea]